MAKAKTSANKISNAKPRGRTARGSRNQQKQPLNAPMATGLATKPARDTGHVRLAGSSTLGRVEAKMVDGQVVFHHTVSPTNVPTLKAQSDVFQKYRFTKLRACILTTASSTETGMYAAGFIRDPVDQLETGEGAINTVDAQPGSARSKVWQSITIDGGSTGWLWTNESTDLRMSAARQLAVVFIGASTNSVLFEAKLDYVVEFKDRTLQEDSTQVAVSDPVIKPGVRLGTQATHAGIFWTNDPNSETPDKGWYANDCIDFSFPIIPTGTADGTFSFRWRAPVPLTYVRDTTWYYIREIAVRNEGGHWAMYPGYLGKTERQYDEKVQGQTLMWLDEHDHLTPVQGNSNPAAVMSSPLSLDFPKSSIRPSSQLVPTLDFVMSNSKLLRNYLKAGLHL